MKKTVHFIVLSILFLPGIAGSQIITPVIRANFGVEADLKANFFNGVSTPGNDDWFPGESGSGGFMIDTTGAAAIMQEYLLDPTNRKKCFTRPMNYPVYSIVNGKFLYDALYIRDHYKNDSTAFTSSNKNGQSPGLWTGGTTPVPDKNDLNDVMVHIRRDGPSLTDSLWFFAGLSLHGNNGNRYFDIELYQSDIYLNGADYKFYNYGPDAGHTSWKFDALGNVISPGDVIFSAEFGSSSLTLLEARIWIDKNSLSMTPTPFSWGGEFDGDGSGAQFGYASILPKTAGVFYTGTQSTDSTWAGPFGFVDIDDILNVDYQSRDFMEIGVNMTKIGLDPYVMLGINGCNLAFRRFVAKTRSSTSFTSSLKDFVGPYLIARPAPPVAIGDSSLFCGKEPDSSTLTVQNPVASSDYTWSTLDGHIATSPATGLSVIVDMPGTYIVTQTLFSGCMPYSTDTITLVRDSMGCKPLATENVNFTGRYDDPDILLKWTTPARDVATFEIERSTDGRDFRKIASINAAVNSDLQKIYELTDPSRSLNSAILYYRLKMIKLGSSHDYSRVIVIRKNYDANEDFSLIPNPARNYLQVHSNQNSSSPLLVQFYNSAGHKVYGTMLNIGSEKINLAKFSPGFYVVHIMTQDGLIIKQKKLMISGQF